MKRYLFFALFAALFPFGLQAGAQAPANCDVDITSGAPEDWSRVLKVKGDDGFVWQRAVINSKPSDLTLEENKPVKIYGVARPYAPVQVFLFAHEDLDGDPSTFEVKKPDNSVCLMAEGADETGLFKLNYSPTLLWRNLGEDVVADAFFRTNQLWSDYQKTLPKSNQIITVGSHVLPIIVKMVAAGNAGNCPEICDLKVAEAIMLNPDDLPPRLKGGNLAYASSEVKLARFPGPHTYYATIDNATNVSADLDNLRRTAHKIIGMEVLKRTLLGNKNAGGTPPGLQELSVAELLAALEGSSQASKKVKDLVKNIRSVMIYGNNEAHGQMIPQANAPGAPVDPPPDPPPIIYRDEAIAFLTPIMDKEGLGIVAEIFPEKSSSSLNSQWATDFLQMMDFWTDQLDMNSCVMADDQSVDDNYLYSAVGSNLVQCGYNYVSGNL